MASAIRPFVASQRALSGSQTRASKKSSAIAPAAPNSSRQSCVDGHSFSMARPASAAAAMPTDCKAMVATVILLRAARGMSSDT